MWLWKNRQKMPQAKPIFLRNYTKTPLENAIGFAFGFPAKTNAPAAIAPGNVPKTNARMFLDN
jgi:hypothetical protein